MTARDDSNRMPKRPLSSIRGDLRIGDRERDEVTRALHDAFAQGRITTEELDERLDVALGAKTAGDLQVVLADLVDPDDQREQQEWRLPYRGELHTWGHHMHAARTRDEWRAQRRAARKGRPGPPPFVPALIAVMIVIGITAGPFVALKIAFIAWIIAAVVGGARHHRGHR